MMENEKERPIIHIQTGQFGPHGNRVAFVPKDSDKKKYVTWLWTLAAIIVGVSVSYFTYDTGRAIANFLNPDLNPSFASQVASAVDSRGASQNRDIIATSSIILNLKNNFSFALGGKYSTSSTNTNSPRTSSLSYLVADIDTGEIILEKKPDLVLPIASVSKLVSALVAKDVLDGNEKISVSRSSVETYGNLGGLKAGENILVSDLFYPLLIESSNDAAEILARAYGRDAFLRKMNEKAGVLKMANTFFDDPSGLSAKDVSSAKDLFLLAKHIDKEHPDIWNMTRVKEFAVLKHDWLNNNPFIRRSTFLGGKNGYTFEADRTTVSVFEVNISKQKRRIVIINLKSNSLSDDVDSIIRFLERSVTFIPEGQDANATSTIFKS